DLWLKVSYPFFHADHIHTPTLFVGGEKDFNVPLLGSEQMYQALRSLGVDSQLVIYPGQFHSLTTPSYKKDRFERYLEWYGKYLKAAPTAPPAGRCRAPPSALRLVHVRADHVLADRNRIVGQTLIVERLAMRVSLLGLVLGSVTLDSADVLVHRPAIA